ncbi:MAG: ABC transporter permease [Burkholderiales bacterium]|nr:ABC transporter permease [Anaerolineae bacterium]
MTIFDAALLASTVRLFTPILLAALGGMFTARAGIFNVALEGMMLVGSFFAVAGVFWTGNPYLGLLLAVAAATLIALLFGYFVIEIKGDAVIIGLAINIFALGFTTYAMRLVFGVTGGYYDPSLEGLPDISLPIIRDIPVLGTMFSDHSILVYGAFVIVVLAYLFLFHHPFGLHLRAVGENSEAAGSLGIRVKRVQYVSVALCGILCGLAGAQLSISLVTQFVEGMTAGRGFIALVAVMFGQAHPIKILGASLLFGLAYAASLRLQGIGIPTQFVAMLPYVATLVVLIVTRIRPQRQSVKEQS